MYCHYFGFSEDPFQLTPDPQFLFLDEIYREAMAHLEYGVRSGRGFIMLSGEVGTGKTMLVHSFLKNLREEYSSAFIFSMAMNFIELLQLIHEDLGTGVKNDSEAFLLIELNRFLLQEHRDGKKTVLILDEAQNLSVELLEKIRMLSNLEARKAKLIQIVLVGQPELAAKLELDQLRQLKQRVAVRFHLPPLSPERTTRYIEHRLGVANAAGQELFTAEALEEIHTAAGGIPRLINVICSNSLLLALGEDTRLIDRELVAEVVSDLARGVPTPAVEEVGEKVADTIAAGVRGEEPRRIILPAAAVPPEVTLFPPADNRPMTTQEAGAYLRVSTKTVRALFQKGLIRATKVGRGWRTFKKDLDDYIRFGPASAEKREEERAGRQELASLPPLPGVKLPEGVEHKLDSDKLSEAIGERWADARNAYGADHNTEEENESTGNGGSGVYRESDGEGAASGGIRPGHSG